MKTAGAGLLLGRSIHCLVEQEKQDFKIPPKLKGDVVTSLTFIVKNNLKLSLLKCSQSINHHPKDGQTLFSGTCHLAQLFP